MDNTKNIHIIFFKGMLETLDYFIEKMVQGAKINGFDYYVADSNREESYSSTEFYNFIKQQNSIMITFNQIGVCLYDDQGCNVWEKYDVQIYDILVDHPRNFTDTLSDPVVTMNLLCIDNDHVRFIKKFYPKIKKVAFLGHGGAQENVVDYNSRKYQVLYVGDCQQNITEFPIIKSFEDGGSRLYSSVLSKMINDARLTTQEALEEYMEDNGIVCNIEAFYQLYSLCAPYIETYIRRYYKQLGMRELDKLGIIVDVFGKNWDDEEYQYSSNIRLHDRVTSRECNYMAGDAKICLNFMPWFKEGTTERVYNAMLNKAVCVSDKSSVLENIFTDGKDIVFFDLSNPLQMAYDVKFLLEHPEVAEHIANNGYKIAMEKCTWECRLLDIIGMHINQ